MALPFKPRRTRIEQALGLTVLVFLLIGGFVVIGLSLRYLAVPFQELYDFAIRAMLEFAQPALQ